MSDTITNLIADIRKWEKNAKANSVDPNLTEICSGLVPVLDSIATRLEQLVKDGFYVTPEAARKFAEEQSKKDATPIDPSAPTLNQILKNPPFEIYRYSQMKSLPRGIEMKEFVHSDGSITFIGQYFNKKNAQPNRRPKRVYRAEICAFGADSDWRASLWEDDDLLAKVGGSNKWNVAYAALGALRGILHKRCVAVRSNRRRRAAAAAATNH